MHKQLILASFLGALLAAPALHAQTTPAGKEGDGHSAMQRYDCSKASDPKACEERRAKRREVFKQAAESCKGKERADRRSCMVEQMCAQSKDPGKCRERAAKRSEHRERGDKYSERRREVMKACEGKKDDEFRKCVRDERAKRREEKK